MNRTTKNMMETKGSYTSSKDRATEYALNAFEAQLGKCSAEQLANLWRMTWGMQLSGR